MIWVFLSIKRAIISAIFRTITNSIIYKDYEEMKGTIWSTFFHWHWKGMENWVETKTIKKWGRWMDGFFNGTESAWRIGCRRKFASAIHLLFFLIPHIRSLVCMERDILQTCHPLWSTVRLSVFQPDNRHLESSPYPPPGSELSSYVGWTMMTCTSTQSILENEVFVIIVKW